jgi:hypothetical protein
MQPGSCLLLEPLPPGEPGGPQRTRVYVLTRADAGIKHVPEFLIQFVLKVRGLFIPATFQLHRRYLYQANRLTGCVVLLLLHYFLFSYLLLLFYLYRSKLEKYSCG